MTEGLRRVLVLNTGGTIGMLPGPRGYRPASGHLKEQLLHTPRFHDPEWPELTTPVTPLGRRIHYNLLEYEPLVDSSNMGMADWRRIAEDIVKHRPEYDAFVILHGTDTMAYTASALSFMLEHLDCTVILTGAQIPFSRMRSDGVDNLLGALMLAGHYVLPEVCIYFHHKLMRGNRARKVDAAGFEAFESSNYPPLAELGTRIKVHTERALSLPRKPLRLNPITAPDVAALRLFPGLTASTLRNFLKPPIRGVVLETYGSGNAPDTRPDLHAAIQEAIEEGVVIVNCTQCDRGSVTPDYAAGNALVELGVVGCADMTTEAALTKLGWLLSQNLDLDDIRRRMAVSLRGELTPPDRGPARHTFSEHTFVRTVAESLAAESAGDVHLEVRRSLEPVLLCSAASLGDVEALERMLAAGADLDAPDYEGRTPLHLAAGGGHLASVRWLLGHGARTNLVDHGGATPLWRALRRGHDEVAAVLVAHGGTVDASAAALSLCAAAARGDAQEVRRWLVCGASTGAQDFSGRTPLHLAAMGGHLEAVVELLDAGAEPDRVDRQGQTAWDEAVRTGHHAVARLLEGDSPDESLLD